MYPNPFSEIVWLQASDKITNFEFLLMDNQGKVVMHKDISLDQGFQLQIDLKNFNAGLYILLVKDEQGKVVSQNKLIKYE
jgi:hypothetical protein